MAATADSDTGKRLGKCPICSKPAQYAVRPFCSRRCADIDLARWLGGGYVIAGGTADADEDGFSDAVGAGPNRTLAEGNDDTD